MKRIDISGLRYGRLLVVAYDSPGKNGGSVWLCRCECGAEVKVKSSNLRSGSTRSCGCLASEWASALGSNREFVRKRAAKVTAHGHSRRGVKTPEYRTWLGMKRRCYDEKYKDFPNWGGRGIKVCERWNESRLTALSSPALPRRFFWRCWEWLRAVRSRPTTVLIRQNSHRLVQKLVHSHVFRMYSYLLACKGSSRDSAGLVSSPTTD